MARSFLILLLAAAVLGASACSSASKKAAAVAASQPKVSTPTLVITPGIKVMTTIEMPKGFAPLSGHPPMWLQNGQEIAVAGTVDGHVVILGFSGAEWHNSRVLAAETGPGAAEDGRIVDFAASPNGMTLATAVVVPSADRLDIVLRDLIANGAGHPITSFDGVYDVASLGWLNNTTIALALRPSAKQPAPPPPPVGDAASDAAAEAAGEPPPAPPKPTEGLQLIVVSGPGSVAPKELPCRMTAIYWNPTGVYGVGAGDATTPPFIIDRAKSTCTRLPATAPVRVLAWAPGTENAFIYVQPVPSAHSLGVFGHDITAGTDKLLAVSSAAAGFTATGAMIALGNQKLSWKMLEHAPLVPIDAEIAIFDPSEPQVAINKLGFRTVPPMLAQSTMAYSQLSDRALIQTFAPAEPIAMRKFIEYSTPNQNAFQIAYGPARGVAEASWSPKGRWVAIVDGDASAGALTVILPPQ